MSSHLNRQFVQAYQKQEAYQTLMRRFQGNGCDLIFNHFVISRSTLDGKRGLHPTFDPELQNTDLLDDQKDLGSYYGRPGHIQIRGEICKCLNGDFTAKCFQNIPLHWD